MKINNQTVSLVLLVLLIGSVIGFGVWVNNLKNQQYVPDNTFKEQRDSILRDNKEHRAYFDSMLHTLRLEQNITHRNITNKTNIILNEIDKADSIRPIFDDRLLLLHTANRTARTFPRQLPESEGFDNIQQ